MIMKLDKKNFIDINDEKFIKRLEEFRDGEEVLVLDTGHLIVTKKWLEENLKEDLTIKFKK